MTDSRFWDRFAPRYSRKPIADPETYEATLARVLRHLTPTDRLLEIGCGTGGTALRLSPHVTEVLATDYSEAMIAIAKGKLGPEAPTNVQFLRAEIADPVPGAPFDVICAFNLLHLAPDLPAALAAIRGKLRPGGRFISKSSCIGDMGALLPMILPVMRFVRLAPAVTVFTAAELNAAVTKAGFAIIDATDFGKNGRNRFLVATRT